MSIFDKILGKQQDAKQTAKARYLQILMEGIDNADVDEVSGLLTELGYSLEQCKEHSGWVEQINTLQPIADDMDNRQNANHQAGIESRELNAIVAKQTMEWNIQLQTIDITHRSSGYGIVESQKAKDTIANLKRQLEAIGTIVIRTVPTFNHPMGA